MPLQQTPGSEHQAEHQQFHPKHLSPSISGVLPATGGTRCVNRGFLAAGRNGRFDGGDSLLHSANGSGWRLALVNPLEER